MGHLATVVVASGRWPRNPCAHEVSDTVTADRESASRAKLTHPDGFQRLGSSNTAIDPAMIPGWNLRHRGWACSTAWIWQPQELALTAES